ncbi:hypothetical protein KA478_04495 [Patescibacteria group bacterium]|nr:hypothetical protein [Patescibacteria group bacterium]
MPAGDYTARIQYIMSIPSSYVNYIENLRKNFGINFNTREKHILALYPEWSTRGVLYAPKNITLSPIQ